MKPGDKVAVLDDTFTGVVLSVEKDKVFIETTDGFQMTYFVNELVKILNSSELYKSTGIHNINKIKQEKADDSPSRKPETKRVKGEIPPAEYDLHIEKLVKNHSRMDQSEILELQLSNARYQIESAIKKRAPKIILIHGVGEGILKSELGYLLRRYDNVTYREAAYNKYGLGAMEVSFRY
ncbi:Smr/MutS family protein [Flavobacterium silvaticum]|uniref:DNA mismatch repair protein MutS n=1 Tax=Flavobacterium silvaticum TaxID=1852020 RepID=A0A972FJU0_9FLAO|nr:Smr/MutS family protein [Flavobacterium silvaticum]NMH27286.1 DNA mismatch repair protein MutS [Flavobacterium silvaticum]